MGFNLPFIFALFTVAVVASHAALTPELYWNKVLPGTSMPKAIRESLNPELVENKSSSVTVVKDGNGNNVAFKGYGRADNAATLASCRLSHDYATAKTLLKDYPNVALFFLENDLVPGKMFKLQFTRAAGPTSFLPREVADSIPFSSHNFTNILNRFSINPESKEAKIMRQTIRECEKPGMSGEQKYCATSLESMIDFSTKILGKKNVKAVSTESKVDTRIMKYEIVDHVKILTGDEKVNAPVVCHKQAYVYAVFYCHSIKSTTVYMVSLKSENEGEAKAIAVCHEDTSKWNHGHLAFQMTGVKPGTVPICHFLVDDTVVWYRN